MEKSKVKAKKKSTYILINDGFDEYEVVLFLNRFRRAGLQISSVSLSDRMVFSRQGVGIKADFRFIDWPFPLTDCLLILPAGGHNETRLRQDVRIRTLLSTLDLQRTDIAVTARRSQLISDLANQMGKAAFLPRGHQGLTDFAESLVDRLIV